MSLIAQRFAQTIGMYFAHEMARQPRIPEGEENAEGKEEEDEETPAENTRHANSTRAVQTRKAKYGKSKLKRKTREGMHKKGADVDTEGE